MNSIYQVLNCGDLSGFRDAFLANIKNAHDAGLLVAGGDDRGWILQMRIQYNR